MEWVPRRLNQRADAISRIVEVDDWQVSVDFFNVLNSCWGPFTVDLFANNINFKVKKFYSRFWTDGTAGVDCFAFDWHGENCWVVPPVRLVGKTILHLIKARTRATLIVPLWYSAAYWPLLVGYAGNFRSFVVQVKRFTQTNGIFVQGSVPSIFGPGFNSPVLALRIDTRNYGLGYVK